MMKKRTLYMLAILSIIIAAGLWGMQGVLLIPQLYNLPVDFVVFFSYALPFLVMNIFYYKEYLNLNIIPIKDILVLSMIGLLGGVVGTLAIVKALFLVNFNNLSVVVLIQKTQPVFGIIMARLFLKEKINRYFYIWAIIVMLGVYFMSFGFAIPVASNNILPAALLAIVSAFCFASGTIFGRYLSKKLSSVTITFYRYGFASIFGLIVVLLMSGTSGFSELTFRDFIFFILIAATSGPLAMFIYYFGLKYIKASVSSICELSLPITAIVLEYIVYGGILSSEQWVGVAVMIFGIYRITRTQLKKEEKKTERQNHSV